MEKVTCPVCSKLFKEINLSHLRHHNLTVAEFDKLYPHSLRMSTEQRRSKARYTVLTDEMSAKLKRSQTLQGFIEKYGEEEGSRRWNAASERKSLSKTVENFIKIYGEQEGRRRHELFTNSNKRKMSLDGFVDRYGEQLGKQKYDEHKSNVRRSKTREYYIEKYGIDEGTRRWNQKNDRNSKSSRKVTNEDQSNFKLYKMVVVRLTRNTIKDCGLPNIHLVRKGEYAVDHKFSILEGFRNKIPPYIIASEHNLEVILHGANSSKQEKCSITLPELYDLVLGTS